MSSTNLPKTVLSPPGQCASTGDPQMSPYSSMRAKAKFNEMVHLSAMLCKQEAHHNRMKNLRKELEYLKNTAWKYDTIESYIGQC